MRSRVNSPNINFNKYPLLLVLISILLYSCNSDKQAASKIDQKPPNNKTLFESQKDPLNTLETLYSNKSFFDSRNPLTNEDLEKYSLIFSPSLLKSFEESNISIINWSRKNIASNENLKLPMNEGPTFISNYEGATSYQVLDIEINNEAASAHINFTYHDNSTTVKWYDIAKLVIIGGKWYLDDIQFDPERFDNYTLRSNIAFTE